MPFFSFGSFEASRFVACVESVPGSVRLSLVSLPTTRETTPSAITSAIQKPITIRRWRTHACPSRYSSALKLQSPLGLLSREWSPHPCGIARRLSGRGRHTIATRARAVATSAAPPARRPPPTSAACPPPPRTESDSLHSAERNGLSSRVAAERPAARAASISRRQLCDAGSVERHDQLVALQRGASTGPPAVFALGHDALGARGPPPRSAALRRRPGRAEPSNWRLALEPGRERAAGDPRRRPTIAASRSPRSRSTALADSSSSSTTASRSPPSPARSSTSPRR